MSAENRQKSPELDARTEALRRRLARWLEQDAAGFPEASEDHRFAVVWAALLDTAAEMMVRECGTGTDVCRGIQLGATYFSNFAMAHWNELLDLRAGKPN